MNLESIFIVFGASAIELWLGIPLGLLMKLNPLLVALTAALGSIFAAIMVVLVGENLRSRFLQRHYEDEKAMIKSRLYRIWDKYGVIGLGLISPLLFGSPVGAAVGIAFGAGKKRLIFWMSMGIILWSFGLTFAIIMGFITLQSMNN